jgi:general secretion pathway protein A
LLTGLQGSTALIQVDGQARAVPLAVLARTWRGDMATLWRAPPGYRSKLLGGQEGPVVDWVTERLAQVDGGPGPGSKQTVDAALRARVYAFQLAQGLKPDGVVGATTFMLLNRASGIDEPRLLVEEN